jgi:hypothetical protein
VALYFQIFWLPTWVSALLLGWLWTGRQITARSASILVAWFVTAAALQGLVNSTAAWVVGLLLQTALAITLLLRWRLDGM